MKLDIIILCLPCIKCKALKDHLEKALKITGAEATIRQITNFGEFSKYSANVSLTPILVINGKVEFADQVPPTDRVCKKIAEITSGENPI